MVKALTGGLQALTRVLFFVFSIFLIWVFHGLSENLGEHFHGLCKKRGKQSMKNEEHIKISSLT